MTDPYLGEIRLFALNFAPRGWVKCEGQSLDIRPYQALYSLLGTTFGGNGTTNFNLPDLRGCAILGAGTDLISGVTYSQGTAYYSETTTLSTSNMPLHTHQVIADQAPGSVLNGRYNYLASPTSTVGASTQLYGPPVSLVPLNTQAVSPQGGTAAYNKRQPAIALTYCIATQGLYPPRT